MKISGDMSILADGSVRLRPTTALSRCFGYVFGDGIYIYGPPEGLRHLAGALETAAAMAEAARSAPSEP